MHRGGSIEVPIGKGLCHIGFPRNVVHLCLGGALGSAEVSPCALEWHLAQHALGLLLQDAGSYSFLDEGAHLDLDRTVSCLA